MTERVPLGDLCVVSSCEDAIVARRGGARLSRGQWLRRVRDWSAHLRSVDAVDVALYFEDAFEFSAALVGAWQAGKTPWLLGDVLPGTLHRLPAEVRLFDDTTLAVSIGNGSSPTLSAVDPSTTQLRLFTSGSSGEPVSIRKTLRQLDAEVAALESQFGARLTQATVQGTVSHQHIYGLLFRVLWPLSCARVFAAQRLQYPEQIAALRDDACALVASPAHLKRLPEALDWRPLAQSLCAVFSSGGPLPQEAAQDVERLWQRPAIEVFGSTETGGIAWREGGASGTRWAALPGVKWRVSDEVLEVRSPHLIDSAWYTTQDRARAVEGGFELLGRADRIVKLEERRISLSAIEQRLQQSDLVEAARALVLPGVRAWVGGVIVLTPAGLAVRNECGKPALAQALRAWLEGHVDPIASPRRWRIVADLPVDARGKTSERALQALFRPTRPEPRWLSREPARAEIEVDIDAELAPFEGHFPGAPVLPGVMLVDWAIHWGRQAFAFEGVCRRFEALKFHHVVQPGARLHLELAWRDDARQLEFRYRAGDTVHASGRLRFDAAESVP